MTPPAWLVWALATLVLAATRAAEMRLNAVAIGGAFETSSARVLAGLVAAAAVHAAVIVSLAARSRLADPTRLFAIVGVGLGFVIANNLEAALFGIAPLAPLLWLALLGAAVHGLATLGVTRLIAPLNDGNRTVSPFAGFTPWSIGARVVMLGLIYAVIYFAAGATIYPFVHEFYANKPLPSSGLLFALQVLVRGPLFVAVGALVVAILRSSRIVNATAVACTLAGLGGLTALLAPNPLFPDDIRYVHLAEVGTSNFVFGWIVGWILTRGRRSLVSVSQPGATPPS